MPSTVGDTEGLAVVVAEVVDAAVAEALAVVVAELVDVAVTDGLVVAVDELVGEGLARHALPPGLFPAKSLTAGVGDGLTRGFSGIGGRAAGNPGLAVTVMTIVSDTWVPCACAFAPNEMAAAPAAVALIMNVRIEARRRDPQPPHDADVTDSRVGYRD
jgi:hypothetical protein